jgi:hypothetical protein
VVRAVAVEKLGFPENWLKTDDQKCIRIRRKSFIGHPGAPIFPCALGERVFQQPRLFSTSMSAMARFLEQNDNDASVFSAASRGRFCGCLVPSNTDAYVTAKTADNHQALHDVGRHSL